VLTKRKNLRHVRIVDLHGRIEITEQPLGTFLIEDGRQRIVLSASRLKDLVALIDELQP
jgi:hypothetical protein